MLAGDHDEQAEMVLTSSKPKSAVSADGDASSVTVISQQSLNLSPSKDISHVDHAGDACCGQVNEKLFRNITEVSEDPSCELNEDDVLVLQDFHSNVLDWIGNDSSHYVEDGDKSELEANASLAATPTQVTEVIKDTPPTEVITMETNTSKSLVVDCDSQSEAATTEIMSSDAVTVLTEDSMDTIETMNPKGEEEVTSVCLNPEMMTDDQEVGTKEEEVTKHTQGAALEEIAVKEEFYMAIEGDGIKDESLCTPSSSTEETEADKDEFYMAVEGDGFKEESMCVPSTSKEELTEEKEEVVPGKKDEMGLEKEDIEVAEKGNGIREEAVDAPCPGASDDEPEDEEEDIGSQCSHNEDKGDGEGGDKKEEGEVCGVDEDKLEDDVESLSSSREDIGDENGRNVEEEGDGSHGDKEEADTPMEGDAMAECSAEEHVDNAGEVSTSEEVYEKKEEAVFTSCPSSSETGIETEDMAMERYGLTEDVLCKDEIEENMNEEANVLAHTPYRSQEETGKAVDMKEDVGTEETAATSLSDGEEGGIERKEEAVCSARSSCAHPVKEDEDVAVTEEGGRSEAEDADMLRSSDDDQDVSAGKEVPMTGDEEWGLGEKTGEEEDVEDGLEMAGDSSVMNLADELAAAIANFDEDQPSDNLTADSEMSSEDDSLITEVSSTTLERETSESKNRRLQESDSGDTQLQVTALNTQVTVLRQANMDIKERLESCECRLSDATVALTVRVESLRDARSRIQYLEKENQAKDEALNDASETIAELHRQTEAPGYASRVNDLQNQLQAVTDNLCAAEARIRSLAEELDAQVKLNESLQAAVMCKDEEMQRAEEKTKVLEAETERQVEWQRSVDEVVAGLRRELECKTERTEAYAKETSDAVEKIQVLQDKLNKRDDDLAEANKVIQSKQMQADSEVERNEALKIEMNTGECKALEQLIMTAEHLHKVEAANESLMGEVSRKTELLSELEARVTALQEELNAKTDVTNQNTGLNTRQETEVVSEQNCRDGDTDKDASFVMKDDLLTDTILDTVHSFLDNTDSRVDCLIESNEKQRVIADNPVSSDIPFEETMASLVKAQQHRMQTVALGRRHDGQEQVNQLQGRITQLNNAVKRMVEEKSALEVEIAGFRQQAVDRQEAHESEVFTLFESYVDLEDKLKERANQPLASVHTGGGAPTKKRASMFYHPEQEQDVSLDTSVRDHSKEVTNLKSALQQSDNMVTAAKLRAEADRQQMQATVEQLELKVASQNEAHNVLVAEMESLHAFTWEMLANERETHKSEVKQLRRCIETECLGNREISQKLDELNEELRTLVEVKSALEDRLRVLEEEKEQWQAVLRQQREKHELELHCSTRNVDLERETSRAELEVMRGSVERRQSQEQLLMQQLQQLQEKLCSVTDLNESLVQEHERLKERTVQLELVNAEIRSNDSGELDTLTVKCDAMTTEIDDLREKVGALTQLSEDLQQKKQALIAEKESVDEQLEALKVLSEKLNSEKTTLTAEKEDLAEELAGMTTQVDSLRRDKEAEAGMVESLSGQVAKLKELSENLEEEKETMSEVNLKMLDDAELMEEQIDQFKQQVEQLTQELEQLRKAEFVKYIGGPPQPLEGSVKLECPQLEDVQDGEMHSKSSADIINSEHSQIITNKTPTGLKRKLDETGFDDDHVLKKNSESAPVETCASCEVRAEELLQLTMKLQRVLDEKDKLLATFDTSRCTVSTGSQTEDETADKLMEQLADAQSCIARTQELLQERDVALLELHCRITELDEEREQQVCLCGELQEKLVKTKEELSCVCGQLKEQNASLQERECRAAELEGEKEQLTSFCGELQEQLDKTQEELQVKVMTSVESENINAALSRKLKALETTLVEERQTVDELHTSFSTLQAEKSSLETDAATLQQALTETNATVADLQESLKVLEMRNECLDKKAAKQEAKYAFLEQCRAEKEGQLEISRMSVSELEVRAGVLASKLQELEEQTRTLESKFNDAISDLEEVKRYTVTLKEELAVTATCLDEANAARSQIEQEFESVKTLLTKTASEKAEVEEWLTTATASLQSETSTREEAEERLRAMAGVVEDKTREVLELEGKLRRTADSLEELCTEKLQEDVVLESSLTLLKSAEQRAESLERKLADSSEAAKEQTAAIEAELQDVVAMQRETEAGTQRMGVQLMEVMQKMERAEAEVKDVSGEKAELERRLRTTVEELEECKRSTAESKGLGRRLEEELTGVRRQLEAATVDVEAGQEEAGALRKETQQLRDAVNALGVEKQTLQQAGEEAAERLKEAEDKCTMKTEEIDRLNEDLEEVAKENEKMVQFKASMRELCDERDALQGKVTLLTSNARRMDKDMKQLQTDYDKLYNDKHQVDDQVLQMQNEISDLKKEIEALNDRLKNEVDELNEKLAKKMKDVSCYLGRFQSLLKRYNLLEEENDKLKDELEGPVVTPPRASRRLQKVVTKAGAKRSAGEADVSALPKKILRSHTQKQQSVIIPRNHQDVKDDRKPLKAVDSTATSEDVKRSDLATKSKSLGETSSEEWVTTRQRSRAHSGGLKQKSFDEKVTCGKLPDVEQRALATISNSPRKVPPATLPPCGDGKPVVAPQPERAMRTRRSQGKRDPAAGKLEAENCKVQ